jgi:hypothetical protein
MIKINRTLSVGAVRVRSSMIATLIVGAISIVTATLIVTTVIVTATVIVAAAVIVRTTLMTAIGTVVSVPSSTIIGATRLHTSPVSPSIHPSLHIHFIVPHQLVPSNPGLFLA